MHPALPTLSPLRQLHALLRPTPPAGRGATLLTADFTLAALDQRQLQRYRTTFGFRHRDIPLPYYAVIAQRAQLALMLRPDFAYRIAGVIHAEQAIEQHDAVDQHRPLQLHAALTVGAPTDNGRVSVDIAVQFTQDARRVVSTHSRLVVRRGRRTPEQQVPQPQQIVTDWQTTARDSRAYALLSGDVNPIHLAGWSARLFGLKQPIVHGMASLARSCAALETLHAQPLRTVTMRFRRPIAIGSSVGLALGPAQEFALIVDALRCVEGRAAHLDAGD